MGEKFLNRYRIPSARLIGYDYASAGLYFITICTHHREPIFGAVVHNAIELNDIGYIVSLEWEKSFQIRRELYCDTFTIMPNHIHAIIGINVETSGRTSLRDPNLIQPKSISSFVGGFKSATTKRINQYRRTPCQPVWQSRFYDRIIRNEKELFAIREYVVQNPKNWENDKNNIS